MPTGDEHIPLDPNAELAVGEGEVRVAIPRFSLSHHTFQAVDSAKYLAFSTRQFELPPDRPATFAVDLAVTNVGGDPADFRRGMAAFHVVDLNVSKRVFAVCGTSTRVFALHEQLGLGGGGAGEAFYHVVESPYEDFLSQKLSALLEHDYPPKRAGPPVNTSEFSHQRFRLP